MIIKDYQIEMKPKKDLTSSEMLKVIFDFAGRIACEKKLDKLLMILADMGREITIADRCTVWLVDKKQNMLWTKVAHGVNEIRIPMNTGLVGYSVSTGEQVIIDDAQNDSRFNKEVDKNTGYKTKSILVIPVENSQGEIIGAFQALNKLTYSGRFSKKDLEHLMLTAAYSGKSIEAALLIQEIEETQKEIVFLMGEIGESRSKETGNHVKRVAEYSKLIALKLGLGEEDAEILKIASPMHDIGKVAISDDVLKKPGKLTDEEFDTMKKHTVIGYNILKGSTRRIIQAASIVASQHHEKWNGKGYPNNLKGEEIHIYGRITALADVFDALGSDRCYKKAWELDRIFNLFKEEKGQHFCPGVVDAFFGNIGGILDVRDTYRDICE